jgi:molybdopterin/thiamine biosynthesis adenylyltransferase
MFQRNPVERGVLKTKHVSVIGCGSVGSAISDMLVRAGIGKLTLTDPDVLSEENLGRHILTRKDIGRPKVVALKERFLDINPVCVIDAKGCEFNPDTFAEDTSLPRFLKNQRWVGLESHKESGPPNLLVSCVDSYHCESLVNSVSLARGIPAVYVGVWGEAKVGEIFYHTDGPCLECYSAFRNKVEIPVDQRKYTDPDWDDSKVPGQAGLWPNIQIPPCQ